MTTRRKNLELALSVTLVFTVTVVPTLPVIAGELFVDQNHPKASDSNSGTEEAPWKTIQKAADTATAGDTVWIKAGEYREDVVLKNDGDFKKSSARFITFAAWKDDPVVLLGTRVVPEEEWQPVEGQENVFAVPYLHPTVQYRDVLPPTQAFVDGKRLPEAVKIVGIDEETGEQVSPDAKGRAVRKELVFYEVTDDTPNCWGIDKEKRLVVVNAGGGNPSAGRTVELSSYSVWLDHRQYVRIKGLTLRRTKQGIYTSSAYHCIIEDCLITEPGGPMLYAHRAGGWIAGISMRGAGNIIRRNTVLDSQFQGINWGGHGFIIEDNLIGRCNMHPAILPNQWFGVLKSNAGSFSTIRHNVLVDTKTSSGTAATGIWCDISSEFNAIYGNTVAHGELGVYVEYTQNFNFIGFNALQDLHVGVGLRANDWNLVYGNYINRSQYGVNAWDSYRNPVMTAQRVSHNWLLNIRHQAISLDPPIAGDMSGSHDYNVFWPANSTISRIDGRSLTKIADVYELTGQERHGKIHEPADREIGLIKFRVPYAENSEQLLVMLANPMLHRQAPTGQGSVDIRPYFWRPGRGDYTLTGDIYPGWMGWSEKPGGLMATSGGPAIIRSRGAWTRQWVAARGKETTRADYHWGLKVEGVDAQAMHELGEGWWTPCLPTRPGTRYTVSLQIRAMDLKPLTKKDGPVGFALWTNDTAQKAIRSYLVGVDDAGNLHGSLPQEGTFGWTDVSGGEVVAPAGATRVAFFLGLKRASGTVGYNHVWIEAN